MRTIFHIDDSTNWNLILGNVQSMLDYAQKQSISFEIEVLANSLAVRQYAQISENNEIRSIMVDLAAKQIKFAACRKAVKNCKIDERDLFPFVELVPSGVVELTLKQSEGFAYIKP
nr:DsrE family protein [uncultured Caproiciproducens sp.]